MNIYDKPNVRFLSWRPDTDREAWFTASATHHPIPDVEAITFYIMNLKLRPNGLTWLDLVAESVLTPSSPRARELGERFSIFWRGGYITIRPLRNSHSALERRFSSRPGRSRGERNINSSQIYFVRDRESVYVTAREERKRESNLNLIYATLSHGVKSR